MPALTSRSRPPRPGPWRGARLARRSAAALLLAVLGVAAIPAGAALAATAVTAVSFSSTSTVAADPNATWTVRFTTSASGALSANFATITLVGPTTPTPFPLVPSAYRVNGALVIAAPTFPSGASVRITTPVSVAASSSVTVVFTGMTNPVTGSYPGSAFSVATSSDTAPAGAASGMSTSNAVRSVLYSPVPDTAGITTSTWTVGFTASPGGSLAAGTGTITLSGPAGTVFPLVAADYTVSGTAVVVTPTQTSASNVTITTPVAVGNTATTTISASHVTNPAAATYAPSQFSLHTSVDTVPEPAFHPVLFSVPLPATETFIVDTTADTPDANLGDGTCADSIGRCSLRAAVQEADADNASAVNVIVPSGTYDLTRPGVFDHVDGSSGNLEVTTPMPLVIEGQAPTFPGAVPTTFIDGGGRIGSLQDRILLVGAGAQVALNALYIRNGFNVGTSSVFDGSSCSTSGGGAIANYGTLTVTDSVLYANLDTALDYYCNGAEGGGIYSDGTLNLTGTEVASNAAQRYYGGGVDCDGACNVVDSGIFQNIAADDGGGFDVDGSLTLVGSTVWGNTSSSTGGGGIGCWSTCSVLDSTIANNTAAAGASGGGIYVNNGTAAKLQLSFSTVAGNAAPASSGGGIWRGTSGSVTAKGSIIASSAGGDCKATTGGAITTDDGYNLDSDGTCALSGTGDLSAKNPQLGTLADNGGSTETMLPATTSPVVDQVPFTSCTDTTSSQVTTDQRGYVRPEIGKSGDPDNCDIGSVEIGPAVAAPTPMSAFHPLPPARICDTRTAVGVAPNQCSGHTLGAGGTLGVHVAGFGGVPQSGATVAVLNVTVTDTTAPGWLTIWPSSSARPTASSLNWAAGESIANLVTVALSPSGSVGVYNFTGSADVVIDVEGYYAPGANGAVGTYGSAKTGGLFNPVNPVRICDTRVASGVAANPCNHSGTLRGTLTPGGILTLTVAGSGAGTVPASGAEAVVLNVTAIGPTGRGGYLTVWPAGGSRPTASNVNFSPEQTIPNRVTVKLGTAGRIEIYNFSGDTDVAVDVNGWFADGSASDTGGTALQAGNPTRICDTRSGSGTPCAGKTLTGGAATGTLTVAVGGHLPPNAVAVIANVTATDTTAAGGFLTVYPANLASPPVISDLNWTPKVTIANMTPVKLDTSGNVKAYTYIGSVDVIVDVDAWYDVLVV